MLITRTHSRSSLNLFNLLFALGDLTYICDGISYLERGQELLLFQDSERAHYYFYYSSFAFFYHRYIELLIYYQDALPRFE